MLRIPGAVSGPPSMLGAAQDVSPDRMTQSEKAIYDEGVKKGEDNVSSQKWWALGIGLALGFGVGVYRKEIFEGGKAAYQRRRGGG